jgi:RND family efflux transporter MFP subunit
MRNSLISSGTKVLAFALLSCLTIACKEKNQNRQAQLVNVIEVGSSEDAGSNSYPAKTEAQNNTDLSFKLAGTISQVLVKEGDRVVAGQVVARLDGRDYRTQLRATEAEYSQIKAECERVIAMHKERAVSDNNYDKARYGLQQITEKLAHHRNQVNDCVLHAPFSGFVDRVYKKAMETTGPGMPVLSVYSSGGVDVVINIPERAYMQRNQEASYTVTFSSIPDKTFPLVVRSVASMANANHLYEMRLSLKETVADITPGMTAMVYVDQKQAVGVVSARVPMGAVWAEGQQSYVFVYDKKTSKLKKTKVQVERIENDGTVVLSQGLQAGSQIVASGVHHLVDGQKVSVRKNTSDLNVGNLK